MNGGGVRTDLVPGRGGTITYGQLFALQPFGNGLVVETLTGAQLKQVLEQQFSNAQLLSPSAGLAFTYDPARPLGQRLVSAILDGKSIDPAGSYRVVANSFMASGGDNYSVLLKGSDRKDVGVDLDALEAYLARGALLPTGGRVKKLAAAAAAPHP
jgi:5'-nucleotidase